MQLLLPIFPTGVKYINSSLAVLEEDGTVYYYHGILPIFSHLKNDLSTFKMFTAQLCANGSAKQCEIVKAFGVCGRTLIRAVTLYREKGVAGFYAPQKRRGPAVFTEEVLVKVQKMLDDGNSVSEVAKETELKTNTLEKAIRNGKLHKRAPSAEKKKSS